jgi:hypothetical protein
MERQIAERLIVEKLQVEIVGARLLFRFKELTLPYVGHRSARKSFSGKWQMRVVTQKNKDRRMGQQFANGTRALRAFPSKCKAASRRFMWPFVRERPHKNDLR